MNCENVSNSWLMPITPGKPILTESKLIQEESTKIKTSNWQDLLGIYSGLLQEETTSDGVEQLNSSSAATTTTRATNPAVVGEQGSHSSLICNNSYNQKDGNCSGYIQAKSIIKNQDEKMNSYQKNVYKSQEPTDGVVIPYWPFNNLLSPLRIESRQASAGSCFQLASAMTTVMVESRQSSAGSSFQLPPATPDQRKQVQNSQLCNIQHSPTDQRSSSKTDQPKSLALSVQQKQVENFPNDIVQGILESPAGGITPSPGESQPYLDENYEGINLNKTPKQRTPKRRKHRPKVVREGKRKGTVNATTPLPTPTIINNESQPKKRNYVRKKKIQASPAQTENTAEEVKIPEVQSASKSCRRVLNFDLQEADRSRDRLNYRETKEQEGEVLLNLNSNYQNSDCRVVNNNGLPSSMFKDKKQGHSTVDKHTTISTVMHPTNQMIYGVSSLLTSTTAACTANNLTLDVIARTLSIQNARRYQPLSQNGYNILGEGIGQVHSNYSCLANTGTSPLLQSINMFSGNGVNDQRGSKRAYHQTADVLSHKEVNPLNRYQWLSSQMNNNTKYYVGSSKISNGSPEIAETSKVSDARYGNQTRLPAFTSSRTNETRVMHGSCSTSQYEESGVMHGNILKKPKKTVNQINGNHHVNQMAVGDNFPKQNAFPRVHRYDKQMDDRMFEWKSRSSIQNALVPVGNWGVPFPLGERPSLNALVTVANSGLPSLGRNAQPTQEHEMEMPKIDVPSKKQARRPKISKKVIKKERMFSDHQNLHTKLPGAGSRDQKVYLELVHEILEQLQGLQINDSVEIMRQDGNALVPYIGNGSVVPYKDNIKRRKPRPKVNLDPETNRLWNLLMWKEGSESTENMDENTEKRWEEERKVFRGRIDSFIARMHLVQGDRRFSPWKGSVVDSVIGVFLTQNVSDHLSSSAFMSLVAKFPFLSLEEEHHQNTSNVIVEEPDLQITEPGGAIGRILSQPVFYQSSTTCSETSEQQTEDIMTGSSSAKKSKIAEEEVISSESSSNSFVYQAIEEVKSNSDANSVVEDQTLEGNFHPDQNPEEHSLQHETNYMFQEHQTNVTTDSLTLEGPEFWRRLAEYLTDDRPNPGGGCTTDDYLTNFRMLHLQGGDPSNSLPRLQQEANLSDFSVEEDLNSLPQVQEEEDHFSRHKGQMSERVNDVPGQATRMNEILDRNVMQPALPFYNSGSMPLLGPITNGRCNKQSTVHDGDTSLNTSEPAGTFSLRPTELTEGIPNEQSVQEGNPGKTKTSTSISNGTKRTIDRQMKNPFDWDSLRRQVQPLGSTKERNKDMMDSLNYEKLRNADVKEISDTIKERGMNNMLAERIKDFLDRLVKEHGSIDLEWLRDVPPEKVKDYLLSIRGLGLKSVECVRLLTLHNVAFPVDTNVGRIAVRLGWVPLQPLPESLQLHLLEMYPVLESIQKYLWPRLCKLDQKTLYELHYQMITFGKVFCTKSRPNCNACPMRAECRHFASAFASVRLSLPGTEERNIVNSVPIAVDDIRSMVINPMLLPQPDNPMLLPQPDNPMLLPPPDNPTEDRGPCNIEPTVEEPKTPEPSVEALESDIEDSFYDDTDEIPTINLNIEEFTTNLQTFMQGHMEMQGDVSKAIVAINPAASYTARQLKDVNRLRTEHYVYELPDSHPLLRGMDRREADDPSPYLLAIWTPGETPDSFRPPESKCGNHASGSLCQEETCFSCNSIREANAQTVRGTLLIPCRTAMKGSFPLNGTYFQVNEMFADHASSVKPIDVPRALIWNLPRRTVYFGTSVTNIFRGLTTPDIQLCFWRGFVCVRGFEQETRSPKPLVARMHFPVSKQVKTTNEENKRKTRIQREQQS